MYQKLPVGVDYFAKLREKDYYYIDKTGFISTLLRTHGEVNLFTRPRRFGKTLNMSMLQAFFEIGTDSRELFKGLEIEKDTELCEAHMNQYPVIFITLKGIIGSTFHDSLELLAIKVADLSLRLFYQEIEEGMSKEDAEAFALLKGQKASQNQLANALQTLSRILHKHYGKKVILLVDEYDVPLDKAFQNNYYSDMVAYMRTFLGEALKTNDDIDFAVVTGCLRISKESIFTGLNNPKIDSIVDERYDEYFGFTDADVRKILADYDVSAAYEETRDWYDGYHFGDADVYCPWDVVNHVDKV